MPSELEEVEEEPVIVVEDRFQVSSLGLVLAPFLPLSHASSQPVVLVGVRPDGTRFEVSARFLVPMPQPTPREHFVNIVLRDATKDEVPIGTSFHRRRGL